MIVTTIRKTDEKIIQTAQDIANFFSIPYIERKNLGVKNLLQKVNDTEAIIVKKDTFVIYDNGVEIFFHPSMAQVRIKRLRNNEEDILIKIMELEEDFTILDCTMGMASDSIVISYALGKCGKIISLEKNPFLHFLMSHGLKNYKCQNPKMEEAIKRIETINIDFKEYLKKQKEKSIDIIYFDPMFSKSLTKSNSINTIRNLAEDDVITEEIIHLAKKIARKKIILKDNFFSRKFEELNFHKVLGGKYSKVKYGVIYLD